MHAVAALTGSHMNGSIPFERTVEHNRNNVPSPKTITAANNDENYKLSTAATLLVRKSSK